MPQKLLPETILSPTEHQVSCAVDNEAALLNLDTGVYFGLDEMGAYIWKLMQTPISFAELQQQVLADFSGDADSASVEADLVEFLNEMADAGFVYFT